MFKTEDDDLDTRSCYWVVVIAQIYQIG